MNDYFEHMFFVPIIHIECRDWDKKQKKLMELFEQVEIDFKGNNWTNYHNDFKKLNKKIEALFDEELDLFLEKINIKTKKINSSWFEASMEGNHHPIHTHGGTGYSAVCYVSYDENEHTPTVFVSPFLDFCNGDVLEHKHFVSEGSLIFFPSSIPHYTLPSKSKKERIVLSFNIKTDI